MNRTWIENYQHITMNYQLTLVKRVFQAIMLHNVQQFLLCFKLLGIICLFWVLEGHNIEVLACLNCHLTLQLHHMFGTHGSIWARGAFTSGCTSLILQAKSKADSNNFWDCAQLFWDCAPIKWSAVNNWSFHSFSELVQNDQMLTSGSLAPQRSSNRFSVMSMKTIVSRCSGLSVLVIKGTQLITSLMQADPAGRQSNVQ